MPLSLIQQAQDWFHGRNWEPFPFQEEVMEAYWSGQHGLLNAPTGSGKTYALWIPILLEGKANPSKKRNLRALWITPLRALSKDIRNAAQEACDELELAWDIEIRTGDTSSSVKTRQKRRMPEGLITTPESLHVLIASKGHERFFEELDVVVVDEWHELLGNKRGVMVELALAHLKRLRPTLRIWGISATIGNMEEGLEVLLGNSYQENRHRIVRSRLEKKIEVRSLLPETVEKFPWAGHLGIHMLEHVLPILEESESTLIFCNTRAQCELWYQALLHEAPDLAGIMAMHHGSIASELRAWVEEALHDGQLKVVVCTSSLDLGVDFRPVDTIIQVGGPKGVARFLQRAGRSGHQPGATSRIYFVPTHSLELIEAAALREAVEDGLMEARVPIVMAYDLALQYLLTLAVGDGFDPETALAELRSTYAYGPMLDTEFQWCMRFITSGGEALYAYDEYRKVVQDEEDGLYKILDKKLARQHRLSIGTILGDSSLVVKYVSGGRIGTIEEYFASQLKPGDVFWFAGRSLELVRIRHMEVQVRRSKSKKGKVPRWMGSRMPLSSQMAAMLRQQLNHYLEGDYHNPEIRALLPLFELQDRWSEVPPQDICLMELIKSRDGYHLFVFPFEGRVIHELLAALMAWRIAKWKPITFSIAMNDYGFELLSDQEIPIEQALEEGIFSSETLEADLTHAINETEMAVRRFREVARVSGLIFQGLPGKNVPTRHLQASTSLLFKVFQDHDPDNLLLKQAYNEVLTYQVDEARLRKVMDRLSSQRVILTRPERFTPFCFPIMVDRWRERFSTEKLSDRVARMQVQLKRAAGG
ncbi:MAG: ligase-associated DNA damage response DEXH box helicase [Bacteroidota bacterium]